MNYTDILTIFDKITLFFINSNGETEKKELQIVCLTERHYTATEKNTKSRLFFNLESEKVIYFNGWNIPIYTPSDKQMYFSGKGTFFFTGKSLSFVGEYIEKNAKGNFCKGDIIYIRNLKEIKQQILLFPGVYSKSKIIQEYKLQQELAEQFEEYESKTMTKPKVNFYAKWKKTAAA